MVGMNSKNNSWEEVMSENIFLKAMIIVTMSTLLFGCAGKKSNESNYSGYLKDYSQLEKEKDAKGDTVLRFVSPRLSSENYKKVIIEPVQYYPEPQPTEEVSKEVLEQITEYIGQALRRELGKKIQVVEQPAPDTLRMRIALTAVGKSDVALKPRQYIPVALVLTGARAAAGAHPEEAGIFLEAETTDSVTGERLAIAVRSGTGERLKNFKRSENTVSVDSIKPLLDTWAEAYAEFLFDAFQ